MSVFGCEQELETYFSKFDCMVDDIPKLPINIYQYFVNIGKYLQGGSYIVNHSNFRGKIHYTETN